MTDNSSKFPKNLECPIDNTIVKHGSKTYFIYRKLNMNPNHLTTLSLIFGLLCIYAFKSQYFIIASILYFISYVYDVLDGNYARKYKMVTKFGDLYDHIKDISVNILLLFVFYKYMTFKQHKRLCLILLIITIILFTTFNIHLGCRELYSLLHKNNVSTFLTFSQKLCKKTFYDKLHILRYFGNGLFIVWVSFLIFLNKIF